MEIILNDQPRQVPDDTSIADLLSSLELQPRHVAVEVNLQLVPRAEHSDYRLTAGDRLEVVTLVGGG